MNRMFINLQKELTPGVVLTLSWGYMTIKVKQFIGVYLISGELLQDLWSSGSSIYLLLFRYCGNFDTPEVTWNKNHVKCQCYGCFVLY